MRFVLDEDVDARLVGLLAKHRHEAWTVASAGLSGIVDDDVTIYAESMDAAVLTHDVEFSARRRKNPHGRHVQLDCVEHDAYQLVKSRLDELIQSLAPFDNVFIHLSHNGISLHHRWQ